MAKHNGSLLQMSTSLRIRVILLVLAITILKSFSGPSFFGPNVVKYDDKCPWAMDPPERSSLLLVGSLGLNLLWNALDDSILAHESQFPTSPVVDILLLGDSVDRMIVTDGCSQWQSNLSEWGSGLFKYKYGAAYTCSSTWGRLSALNLFGAKQSGPYFLGFSNNEEDQYVDTPLRIRKGINQYRAEFGKFPDFIVYQSLLWDMQESRGDGPPLTDVRMSSLMQQFLQDTLTNVDLITTQRPTCSVFLRTAPLIGGYQIAPEYNNILRRVARLRKLGLFDWDMMLRGLRSNAIFRDQQHPIVPLTSSFHRTLVQFFVSILNVSR